MIIYFLLSLAGAALALAARSKRFIALAGLFFFAVQFGLAGLLLGGGRTGETSALFFRFDESGLLFYCLLCVVGAFVFVHSKAYLKENPLKEYRLYFCLLMLLQTAIAGVYFSDNIAVTWIFLRSEERRVGKECRL